MWTTILYTLSFHVEYRKLAEAELQTNISEMEKYTLPSGQEIEKENILSHLEIKKKVIFH